MENKYYDLIISLIKEHKKYAGCEAILEDIANDVYEHAKIVIDSISNDDVVTAYLKKVVSTSIVTVPKKLNFNKNNRHRIITTLTPTSTEAVIDSPSEEESDFLENNTEETIEDQETITIKEDSSENETISEELTNEELCVIENETFDSDNLVEIKEEPTVESDLENSSTQTIDKTLVDKMINGISSNTSLTLEEKGEDKEELTEFYETLEEVALFEEEETIENKTTTELENLIESETIEEIEFINTQIEQELTEENSSVEIIEEIEDLAENAVPDQESVINLEDTTPAFDITEIAESSELEDLEVIEEIQISEDPTDLLESLEQTSELLIDETSDVTTAEGFVAPSYNCFSFEPERDKYNAEEIMSYLNEINEKYPNKQILTICDLKYKQKLSVQEISDKLNLTLEDVIEVLNEIIDAIKD